MKTGTPRSASTIIGSALLLVLLVFVLPGTSTNPCNHPDVNIKDAGLKSWYDFYNEKLFDNSLAKNVKVRYANLDKHGNIGELNTRLFSGDVIRIDPALNVTDEQVRFTLIHEMCHEKFRREDVEDGPLWQSCMIDIAQRGGFQGLW